MRGSGTLQGCKEWAVSTLPVSVSHRELTEGVSAGFEKSQGF